MNRKDGLFTRIPAKKIAAMRQMKEEGFSLGDIALKLHVAKSTVSIYCRDIFDHPKRIYQTEQEIRDVVFKRGVGKNHEAFHRCACGAKIRRQHKRCLSCRRKYEKESGELDKFIQGGIANRFKAGDGKKRGATSAVKPSKPKEFRFKYPLKGAELCELSPTKSHYWIINAANVGTCKHCGKAKQFQADANYSRA